MKLMSNHFEGLGRTGAVMQTPVLASVGCEEFRLTVSNLEYNPLFNTPPPPFASLPAGAIQEQAEAAADNSCPKTGNVLSTRRGNGVDWAPRVRCRVRDFTDRGGNRSMNCATSLSDSC